MGCSYRSRFVLGALLCATAIAPGLSQTRHDVFIRLNATDSLDATYFYPTQIAPHHGYPALLFIHGFGTSKETQAASCSLYAATGYLTFAYSVRGQGNSSGTSTIMSLQERADFAAVVRYLKKLPKVDSTLVGITGGSQGGLHGLWAAADRLSVKAVSTDVIVPGWATDMMMNGCIRRTMLLLLQTGTVRYAPVRDTLWQLARTDAYDSLKAKFARDRDVDTNRLASSPVPVLTFLKWQDHYFSAGSGIDGFLRATASKKLYLGTQGHFSDDSPSEQYDQSDQLTRWFKYFLLKIQTGILNESPVRYAYSTLPMDTSGFFTWAHDSAQTWPPPGVRRFRFYLSPDSALSLFPPTAAADSAVLRNDYLNPSYTFDTAWVEGFRGSRFNIILPQRSIAFNSARLSSDVVWAGVPSMNLFVRSDHDKFPLHAQVYEIDSLGTRYFINRIDFIARNWHPGSEGVVSAEGIPHAHRFTRGNRIRVELTNIDKTDRIVLGSYPFVAPVFANTSATIYADRSHASYIELPLIGNPASVASGPAVLPLAYRVGQNYPNPFNPSTTIRFSLPRESDVTLTVFDAIGRKVATLFDGRGAPGDHDVSWNAGGSQGSEGVHRGAASAVYFYRMTAKPAGSADPPSEITGKMVLLR